MFRRYQPWNSHGMMPQFWSMFWSYPHGSCSLMWRLITCGKNAKGYQGKDFLKILKSWSLFKNVFQKNKKNAERCEEWHLSPQDGIHEQKKKLLSVLLCCWDISSLREFMAACECSYLGRRAINIRKTKGDAKTVSSVLFKLFRNWKTPLCLYHAEI